MTPRQSGSSAPAFSLPASGGSDEAITLSLGDYRGRPLVIAFYPADWSPVCGDQMALYNQILPEFQRYGAELVGVSVDGPYCHQAFAENRRLRFPLLSDFEPKGQMARDYGVYRAADGTSERALFVIDADGVIRWSYVSPVDINPGADHILRELSALAQPEIETVAQATISEAPAGVVTLIEYGD